MAAQKTITINGHLYDAVTGLPIDNRIATSPTPRPSASSRPTQVVSRPSVRPAVQPTPKPVAKPAVKPVTATVKPAAPKAAAPIAKTASASPVKPAPAASRSSASAEAVHGGTQKSKTLIRRATKKPTLPNRIMRRPQAGKHMDIARNTNVSKFAAHPVVKAPAAKAAPAVTLSPDKPAHTHPAAQRALAKAHAKKQAKIASSKPATSKEVKDAAITKALATPKAKAKKDPKNKWVRRFVLIGVSLFALLIILFAIYKFIPSISVSIAAAQAGIEARFPDYTPDGYSLSQPVSYSDGEVNLKFVSNSNDTAYAINQKRSSWDSSAVLDNVVIPAVGENYTTTKERGLTIYTYDKGAAWANGGILYTINGDAALSGDQIRRLATSL